MRLSEATLARLPSDVAVPRYDRAAVRKGVVHLGVGAFHRGHQAVVFDQALASGDLRWGVTGVSLRSPEVRERMAPQGGLYTVLVRNGDLERAQVIGAILEILVAPQQPEAVIAALASPDTHLVTLTVTEKGYKLDRATGGLLHEDADVRHDLASLAAPRTAPGFLVAGLAARRAAGLAPFTAMSCDNLPDNGALLRGAVLSLAKAHDPALARWIAAEGAFPATMVDRIVPATTAHDIAALAARTGVEDQAMVATEPFLQWVVEDRFCGPRPDLAGMGVQLVKEVAPWEAAKLRLLNGAHSAMAYLGGLAGDACVHDFIGRPDGAAFVEALWDEAAETLDPAAGIDVPAYRRTLALRFANSALRHRTRQIAADGSQKLPQRLIAPMLERRARGLPVAALALAVAGWMRWQAGVTDAGEPFAVDDPLADRLAQTHGVDGYLAMLGADPDEETRGAIARHLATLERFGARAAIGRLLGKDA